jgi:hypothetical protein
MLVNWEAGRLDRGGTYDRAIERESRALLKVLATLSAMAGFGVERRCLAPLTRAARNAILRLLRPAEAALCRLIVMVMHDMFARMGRELPSLRDVRFADRAFDAPASLFPAERKGVGAGFLKPLPRSSLTGANIMQPFDSDSAPFLMRRLRDAAKPVSPLFARPAPSAPVKRSPVRQSPDDPVSDRAVCRRIWALQRALRNLPHQARRLASWQAGLRFQSQPLPRKLIGVESLLQKPPTHGRPKRPTAKDGPGKGQPAAARVEFLRWKPG